MGLQRALSVAGARSTLLSLWKVDDDATAYFMERYYTLLQQGKGRLEALLAVQQEFRNDPQKKYGVTIASGPPSSWSGKRDPSVVFEAEPRCARQANHTRIDDLKWLDDL